MLYRYSNYLPIVTNKKSKANNWQKSNLANLKKISKILYIFEVIVLALAQFPREKNHSPYLKGKLDSIYPK